MLMAVVTIIITAGDIIMMLIGIKSIRSTMTTVAKNVIVNVPENTIAPTGRADKIIFLQGTIGHTFILVLVGMITDLITEVGTGDTIAMITTDTDTTNTMAESAAKIVKVSQII